MVDHQSASLSAARPVTTRDALVHERVVRQYLSDRHGGFRHSFPADNVARSRIVRLDNSHRPVRLRLRLTPPSNAMRQPYTPRVPPGRTRLVLASAAGHEEPDARLAGTADARSCVYFRDCRGVGRLRSKAAGKPTKSQGHAPAGPIQESTCRAGAIHSGTPPCGCRRLARPERTKPSPAQTISFPDNSTAQSRARRHRARPATPRSRAALPRAAIAAHVSRCSSLYSV